MSSHTCTEQALNGDAVAASSTIEAYLHSKTDTSFLTALCR